VAELRLSFLGAPAIEIGRKRVETDTRKATALLAYLAVTGQPQRRSTLATLYIGVAASTEIRLFVPRS
jgi:DNA-binding SARP family transcriptional activator